MQCVYSKKYSVNTRITVRDVAHKIRNVLATYTVLGMDYTIKLIVQLLAEW